MRISDWSSDVCSSDLVSTNAGGTQVLRWGTMRGLVAGIEAVLPDGSVYDGLAVLKKDNRGYDLTQLLDRKSVGAGKSVSVRGEPGGRRVIKQKNNQKHNTIKI